MSSPVRATGSIRLLNTSAGRALCLAGAVDAPLVADFVRRYGREPAPVDVVDAASVTALAPPALELLRDHLDAAALAGRPVALRCSDPVSRELGAHR